MKYVAFFGLLVLLSIFYAAQQASDADNFTGENAKDSLISIPRNIDTSIVVYDAKGKALKFNQYIKVLLNQQAMVYMDRGTWKLQRFSKAAMDSLERDDYAVARADRWAAYRNRSMNKTNAEKFKSIARILLQADRITVLKAGALCLYSIRVLPLVNLI